MEKALSSTTLPHHHPRSLLPAYHRSSPRRTSSSPRTSIAIVGILLPKIASRRRCRLPADAADSQENTADWPEKVSGPAAALPDSRSRLIACASGIYAITAVDGMCMLVQWLRLNPKKKPC
ncbi:hypothetical protein Tco_1159837, partial [Tanacetum coccineum]